MNFWKSFKCPISGLSPMHDVTTYLFRELQCQIVKPDVIYTEFVSAEGLSRVPDKFTNQLSYSGAQNPIVAQLFGVDPNAFSKAITTIHQLGFAGVDINMGCPSSKVIKNGGGGALIGDYHKVDKLLTVSIKSCHEYSIPLSVKTRIVADNKKNADWFTFLSNYPLNAVTIHGRNLKQGHSGTVDWEMVCIGSNILKSKGIIVLGNGGINNSAEGLDICRTHNLDGFLIGQSAIGNPYVFSNEPLDNQKRTKIIERTVNLINDEKNKYTLIEIKHFVFVTLKGWPNSSKSKQSIVSQTGINQILEILKTHSLQVTE